METISTLPQHENLHMSSRSASAGQSGLSTLQKGERLTHAHRVHMSDSWVTRDQADGASLGESPMNCAEPFKCSSCSEVSFSGRSLRLAEVFLMAAVL